MLTVTSIRRAWMTILLMLLFTSTGRAQVSTVYGLFFYLPTCAHCHDVINNHWPGIEAEFGDQLRVLFIDASTVQGGQLMQTVISAMDIASNGVPMLIIGDDVLVGSRDIPLYAPQIIREGLAAGGIGYPPVGGIEAVFESALNTIPDAVPSAVETTPAWSDTAANLAAVVVLAGLAGTAALVCAALWQVRIGRKDSLLRQIKGGPGWALMLVGVGIGFVLALSLVSGSLGDPIILLIAGAVLLMFGRVISYLIRVKGLQHVMARVIPLLVLAGGMVAAYLAYVETTLTEATCGAIGDCNAVQQSPYAYVFGVPIGVIGVVGYAFILLLWWGYQFRRDARLAIALLLVALVGTLFSIYLTFLEPFIIQATCTWCLISAVTMGLLLWATAPDGLDALLQPANRGETV